MRLVVNKTGATPVAFISYAYRDEESWFRILVRVFAGFGYVGLCLAGGWLLFIPMSFTSAGTLYGVGTVLRISAHIANERKSGVYELLSLTPPGAIGLSWAVVTGNLYRNKTFARLYGLLRGVYLGIAILLLIAMPIVLFQWWSYSYSNETSWWPPNEEVYTIIGSISLILLFLIALYIDFVHSTVVGILIAVLSPSLTRNRLEAQLLALAGFLGVQLFTYVVTLSYLYAFVFRPVILSRVPSNQWPQFILLISLGTVLFFAIREGLIWLLWRATLHRLQAHASEMDHIGVKLPKEWIV